MQNKDKCESWDEKRRKIIDQYSSDYELYNHEEEELLISQLQEKLRKSRKEIKGMLTKL